MRPRRIASAALLAATLCTVLCAAEDASAFCQTTTCKSDTPDGCPVDDAGCPTTGVPLRWRSLPLTFRFSAQRPALLLRDEARAAIRAAFYRWSDTLCGPDQRRTALRFVEGEDIFEDKPLVAGSRGTQPYGIYFRDRGWPYVGKEDSTLAQTNNIFGKDTGFIEYADMEINTGSTGVEGFSTNENDPGTDLQAVITHEAGHYIGLAHSKVPTSIMVASYCNFKDARCEHGKVAARRLSQDDIDAVCTLYPPDYVSPQDEKKATGCATTPSSEAPSRPAAALLVLGALTIFAARGRRAMFR
jgi:MYXO-CTERM domain-containing protein